MKEASRSTFVTLGAVFALSVVSVIAWRMGNATRKSIAARPRVVSPINSRPVIEKAVQAPVTIQHRFGAPRSSGHERKQVVAPNTASIARPVEVTTPIEKLDAIWKSEPFDAEWSENVQTFVNTLLETVDAGVQHSRLVRCGQTVCKIQFDEGDVPALLRIRSELGGAIPFAAQQGVNPDGQREMVAYIAREGKERAVLSQ